MMSNPNIAGNINQVNVSNVSNVQNVSGVGPNVSAASVSGPNMNVPNVSGPNVSGPTQMQGAPQMTTMNQINPMINMQHMARNQPANVLFQAQGSESYYECMFWFCS